MIINYLLCQCAKAKYVYITFSNVFHIIVTVKITFLLKIESTHDFYINNYFCCGYIGVFKIDVGSDRKQLIY